MSNLYTLVTGGTTGIGFEAAQTLIEEGRQVIITGRDAQRVAKASESLNCLGIVTDSADLNAIQALASTLKEKHVQLNGLVLNAGVFFAAPLENNSVEMFDQTMDINTKGPFFTLQALLPLLTNPSSVVFVSSIAVEKSFVAASVYSASKAAAEAFVRVANVELADRGIRINILRPGVTATEIQGKAGMNEQQQQEMFESMARLPIGRVLTPKDHVGAISFLLSDASLGMRNAVIRVDGGDCV